MLHFKRVNRPDDERRKDEGGAINDVVEIHVRVAVLLHRNAATNHHLLHPDRRHCIRDRNPLSVLSARAY